MDGGGEASAGFLRQDFDFPRETFWEAWMITCERNDVWRFFFLKRRRTRFKPTFSFSLTEYILVCDSSNGEK